MTWITQTPLISRDAFSRRGRTTSRYRMRSGGEIVADVLAEYAAGPEPGRSIALAELVERYYRTLDRRDYVRGDLAWADSAVIIAAELAFRRERARRAREDERRKLRAEDRYVFGRTKGADTR